MEQDYTEEDNNIVCNMLHTKLVRALCSNSSVGELRELINEGEKTCPDFIIKYFSSKELLEEIIEVSQSDDFVILAYLFTNGEKTVTPEGLKNAREIYLNPSDTPSLEEDNRIFSNEFIANYPVQKIAFIGIAVAITATIVFKLLSNSKGE